MNVPEIEELHAELRALDAKEPRPPLVRLHLMQEPTIEALLDKLGNVSRCVSVNSDEAGSFFAGHAMKAEQRARTFAVYNGAWSGSTLSSERKTVASIGVDRPCLTLGFAMQPAVMHDHKQQSGDLDRGTGFAARFLFSQPESTQGTRKYREPPESMPALSAFNARIKALLETPLTYDENYTLNPPALTFTPEAKAAWVAFHDDVEDELGPGGEMVEAKDVSAKAAENCARLAALFHVLENGPAGMISLAHVEAAAQLMSWHLFQFRRYFCELAPTPQMVNAQKLEAWLARRFKTHGEREVSYAVLFKLGPNPVRHRKELDEAVALLVQAKRARKAKTGARGDAIELNPALLEGKQ